MDLAYTCERRTETQSRAVSVPRKRLESVAVASLSASVQCGCACRQIRQELHIAPRPGAYSSRLFVIALICPFKRHRSTARPPSSSPQSTTRVSTCCHFSVLVVFWKDFHHISRSFGLDVSEIDWMTLTGALAGFCRD